MQGNKQSWTIWEPLNIYLQHLIQWRWLWTSQKVYISIRIDSHKRSAPMATIKVMCHIQIIHLFGNKCFGTLPLIFLSWLDTVHYLVVSSFYQRRIFCVRPKLLFNSYSDLILLSLMSDTLLLHSILTHCITITKPTHLITKYFSQSMPHFCPIRL